MVNSVFHSVCSFKLLRHQTHVITEVYLNSDEHDGEILLRQINQKMINHAYWKNKYVPNCDARKTGGNFQEEEFVKSNSLRCVYSIDTNALQSTRDCIFLRESWNIIYILAIHSNYNQQLDHKCIQYLESSATESPTAR